MMKGGERMQKTREGRGVGVANMMGVAQNIDLKISSYMGIP